MKRQLLPFLVWGVMLYVLNILLKRPIRSTSRKSTTRKSEKLKENRLVRLFSKVPKVPKEPPRPLVKKKATAKKMKDAMAYSAAIRRFNKNTK